MGISPLFQLLPSGAVHFPFPRFSFFFLSSYTVKWGFFFLFSFVLFDV